MEVALIDFESRQSSCIKRRALWLLTKVKNSDFLFTVLITFGFWFKSFKPQVRSFVRLSPERSLNQEQYKSELVDCVENHFLYYKKAQEYLKKIGEIRSSKRVDLQINSDPVQFVEKLNPSPLKCRVRPRMRACKWRKSSDFKGTKWSPSSSENHFRELILAQESLAFKYLPFWLSNWTNSKGRLNRVDEEEERRSLKWCAVHSRLHFGSLVVGRAR